jgi:pentatricopeptide repeat protein
MNTCQCGQPCWSGEKSSMGCCAQCLLEEARKFWRTMTKKEVVIPK